jgi:hypothetical protein
VLELLEDARREEAAVGDGIVRIEIRRNPRSVHVQAQVQVAKLAQHAAPGRRAVLGRLRLGEQEYQRPKQGACNDGRRMER